jgi:hypothetical protein
MPVSLCRRRIGTASLDGATRLLTDETYRSAIGANARRLADTIFSVGAVVDDIENLYAGLTSTWSFPPLSPGPSGAGGEPRARQPSTSCVMTLGRLQQATDGRRIPNSFGSTI